MVEMKNKSRIVSMILLLSCALMLSTITFHASAKKTHPGTSPQIKYLGHTPNGDLITFRYQLTSGEPVLKQWEIISPCFTKDRIVSVSEKYSLNPAKNRLRFNIKYSEGEVRIVAITLKTNYYQGIMEGDIGYSLYWEPNKSSGEIKGPVLPSQYLEYNEVSGQLGTIVSSTLSLTLVAGFRKIFSG